MRNLISHRRTIALNCGGFLSIALVIGGLLVITAGSGSSQNVVVLDGVSPVDLGRDGITLLQPPARTTPKVSAEQAAQAARISPDDPPVKQVLLATVVDQTRPPAIDRVLWVVNLDVTGLKMPLYGPRGSPPDTPFLYSIVFVDPETGQQLYTISLGAPIN